MKIVFILSLSFLSLFTSAQEKEIYSTRSGAIRGYDPIAYFTKGEPTEGNRSISLKWKEATWYFVSEANKEDFKKTPTKYAPQFGGYCSYAVSRGYTASIDPEAWKIVDGKLYLNYSQKIRTKWEANQTEYIRKAETNWPKLIEK